MDRHRRHGDEGTSVGDHGQHRHRPYRAQNIAMAMLALFIVSAVVTFAHFFHVIPDLDDSGIDEVWSLAWGSHMGS